MEQFAVLLREAPLFSGLEEREARRLVSLAHQLRFKLGEGIVAQGSAGDSHFLLCEGKLEVSAVGVKGGIIAWPPCNSRGPSSTRCRW
ncbi:MAG: hypothetical protein FJY95_12845 [Candidatus Handelsmanbacteria bacterium]|nr:hypothetical protein [Candidatus Handelsmanbacteria bacterium]